MDRALMKAGLVSIDRGVDRAVTNDTGLGAVVKLAGVVKVDLGVALSFLVDGARAWISGVWLWDNDAG